jgi:RNA polymerase sigma factor (sigma-70 family)
MPPAIARKAAVRFQPNKWVMSAQTFVDAWKGHYALVDELTAEGNLALVESVDHFDTTKGFAFSTYAGRSIWNAVNRRLRSFTSVVDRPWSKPVPLDIYIDPTLPDFLPAEDYCGSMARAAITSDDDKRKEGEPLPGKFARLRRPPDDLACLGDLEHHLDQLPRLQAKTLRLRIAGFKLREVAQELGLSTSTAWRIEQSAYEQMRSLWNSSR